MSHALSAAEWRRCVRACTRVTGSTEDAEDCVQEALVASLQVPDDDIDDVARWVTAVAQRRAVDVVRRRSAAARCLPRVAAHNPPDDPADVVTEREAAS